MGSANSVVSQIASYIIRAVSHSHVHGGSSPPLLEETIGMCLDRICERFANSEALISRHQGLRYTYGQLKQQVENAARGMIAIGVESGDRVGVWSPNSAEWLIAQYALAKVGAIMVNINPAYRIRELEHAFSDQVDRRKFNLEEVINQDYSYSDMQKILYVIPSYAELKEQTRKYIESFSKK